MAPGAPPGAPPPPPVAKLGCLKSRRPAAPRISVAWVGLGWRPLCRNHPSHLGWLPGTASRGPGLPRACVDGARTRMNWDGKGRGVVGAPRELEEAGRSPAPQPAFGPLLRGDRSLEPASPPRRPGRSAHRAASLRRPLRSRAGPGAQGWAGLVGTGPPGAPRSAQLRPRPVQTSSGGTPPAWTHEL